MRALRFDGSRVVLDAAAPDPVPAPGEALIRVTRAAIGSPDRAVVAGRVPHLGVLGHAFVGVVERVAPTRPEHARWEGRRVVGGINLPCGRCERCRAGLSTHCPTRAVLGLRAKDGCFAERLTLPIANLVEVPKTVDDDAATFAEPLAAVLHAAHLTRIEGKPYVTVLGDGPIGLLAAQVMTRLNASVRLLGTHPAKFSLCEKWGIKHRHEREVGRRQDQDVVIDCTGSPSGLELAMRLVRPRGKIVLKSTPAPVPDEPDSGGPKAAGAPIDLSPIARHELEVLGARCGPMPDAVGALARGEVDVRSLVTRRFRLAEGVAAFEAAASAESIRVLLEI